jgi:hypothetical protein
MAVKRARAAKPGIERWSDGTCASDWTDLTEPRSARPYRFASSATEEVGTIVDRGKNAP